MAYVPNSPLSVSSLTKKRPACSSFYAPFYATLRMEKWSAEACFSLKCQLLGEPWRPTRAPKMRSNGGTTSEPEWCASTRANGSCHRGCYEAHSSLFFRLLPRTRRVITRLWYSYWHSREWPFPTSFKATGNSQRALRTAAIPNGL